MNLFKKIISSIKKSTVLLSIIVTLFVALLNFLISNYLFDQLQGNYIAERAKKNKILAFNLLRTSVDYHLAKQEYRLPHLYNFYKENDPEIVYIIFNKYKTEDQVNYSISKIEIASSSLETDDIKKLKIIADRKIVGLKFVWKGIKEIASAEDYYEMVQTINVEDVIIGYLRIGISDKIFKSEVRSNVIFALIMSSAGVAVIVLLNLFIIRAFNLLVTSLKKAQVELKNYADTLEQKVTERTQRLQETLNDVEALKQQQDGDYFLTKLLIKPLSVNQVESESTQVDFFIKQKKEFTFKHWTEDIGGDICIAHTIKLKDKSYTAVLNADAMGKSMQGAGGALVLGTVFEALIVRTTMTENAQQMTPEKWLKGALIELQKVFETFDGSMMISLIMGLIDDATGFFYFVNAEHPWPVILRNNKATFLNEEFSCRKLGMPMDLIDINIMTAQLQANDLVFLGSDGKDDIYLTENENDTTGTMNEDETLFLRAVEKGEGNSENIFNVVAKSGIIKDDFSLLRIRFRSDVKDIPKKDQQMELTDALKQVQGKIMARDYDAVSVQLDKLHKENRNHPDILGLYIKLYTILQEDDKIAEYTAAYIKYNPDKIRYLYLCAVSLRKIGRFKEAADAGERLRIRKPNIVENLINLAKVYLETQKIDSARDRIQEALVLQPENKEALVVQNLIEEKQS